jgi:endonuclease/exonuclease/phosphatase (EEP) superfamily protein YafD
MCNSSTSTSLLKAALRALRLFVMVVVAVVGSATLLGLLDRVWWVVEVADVFRLQYLVVLIAAALAGLLLRRPRLAALAAVLAAVNVAVLRTPAAPNTAGAAGAPTLRLLVANVEVGNTDYAAVGRLVAQTHPDLFGVIELTPVMARHLEEELAGYPTHVLAPRHDAYGIGVYSRRPLLSAKVARFPSDGPPTVVTRLRVGGKLVTVVVTHVRSLFAGSIHARQLDALAMARPQLGRHLVICGDLNTPPWSGPLRRFAGKAGLHDVYGSRAWRAYSWPTWASVLRIPLDDCFVSDGLDITAHHDGPDVGSDHRPLVVDIDVR